MKIKPRTLERGNYLCGAALGCAAGVAFNNPLIWLPLCFAVGWTMASANRRWARAELFPIPGRKSDIWRVRHCPNCGWFPKGGTKMEDGVMTVFIGCERCNIAHVVKSHMIAKPDESRHVAMMGAIIAWNEPKNRRQLRAIAKRLRRG